ncbi:hypothetical protein [Microbacterium sp. Root553]|uniref:hypothetical protein n=1 Tax=Microbacterium sp. Root553 TaxID=1736556 RepID=UPI0006F1D959|nr:hypothetical protein [Microbacterium sp. Root553]KQZ23827.1 hypothetical protein ASD43_05260 [Microbacterium sp. Root553]
MNDTAVTIDEQIRAFASAVRAHLDDLPADELDEIMSGLAADLADQAADNDDVLELGDPAAYAEELRSAAGLPPRSEDGQRIRMRERVGAWRSGFVDGIRRTPFGAWLVDLLLALRPVWWVLRGYGVYVVALHLMLLDRGRLDHWMVPDSPLEWAALTVLVVVSAQWGRGLWLPTNPLRHIRTVASIVAVIALPFALGAVLSPQIEYVGDEYLPQGLRLDGVQINNIFAYDEDGNPIERVQLFTGKGTPLNLYGENGGQVLFSENEGETEVGVQDDGTRVTIPAEDYRGRSVWNIYPLDETDLDVVSYEPNLSTVERPAPPFQKAPSIDATNPTAPPTPDLNATPQPTESPVP